MGANDNPLVSVIVPAYNAQKHLRQCVESIIGQTYAHVEVILVDDGSTDQTSSICGAFAVSDARIRVIYQRNQGVACARNAGLDAANGEYVAFVDSDDWLELDAIECLLSEARSQDDDMVIGGYTRHVMGDNGTEMRDEVVPGPFESSETGKSSRCLDTGNLHDAQCARQICDLDIAGHLYQCWGKLFRRSWIVGLRFEPGCAYGEDTVFVLETLKRGGTVGVLSKALYDYREDSGSLVRGFRMGKTDDFEFSHGRHVEFYKDLPITQGQRKAIDTRLANDVLRAISAVRRAPSGVGVDNRVAFIERIMHSPWRRHYLNALKSGHTDRLTKLLFLLNVKALWRWYAKADR